MDKKTDDAKMLSTILKFYGFKLYKGLFFFYLKTCRDEKTVEIVTYNGISLDYFENKHDVLKLITTQAKYFICDICSLKRVPNIFLGCKSLEEVQVKIDLNANLKV